MAMVVGRGSFIWGENLQQGSRSYPLGFHNEEKTNVVENYGIAYGKVLEYTRELTRGEATDRWAGRPAPHVFSLQGFFSWWFLMPS